MTLAVDQGRLGSQLALGLHDERDWWRGAVIYQVYPRSFQDTSGDGIGDLRGIAMRMPYVASLGVDAIWISPFFASPMKDFGYDISDYLAVDPMFGGLEDFDYVVAEAHNNGIRVMIDLVFSHTSDQHPWFIESRSSVTNARADWYVWADPKPDGTPPNNWLSIFGGSAWAWDTTRCQYYMHNFLSSQPDLNFHCSEVQETLLDMARFWLDRGVDGFRLDVVNFYVHDRDLRDNPPLPPERRNTTLAPRVNPYNHQDHLYDRNRPENLDFLKRLRALMDEYQATAAVGEVADSHNGLQIVADYTSGGDKLHMCYAFDFLSPELLTAERIVAALNDFQTQAPEGWACWAFSNHDVMRHASRWATAIPGDMEKYLRLLAGLLMSLRGSVCLYQGEELGLGEAELAFEQLRDPYGIQFWPDYKGRDGCRTPMVWERESHSAGFSQAESWLPVPFEHRLRAVDTQDNIHGSLLNHYRAFIAFRKRHQALVKGDIEFILSKGPVVAFTRRSGNETLLCAFNLTDDPCVIDSPSSVLEALEGHGFGGFLRADRIELPPYDAFFARIG